MKRGLVVLLFVVFLLLLFLASQNSAIQVIDEQISGKAISNKVNASIQVTNIAPTISIFSPKKDRTYRNTSILLNYSVYDADGISLVWYNVNGTNISLGNSTNNFIYFNTSEGNHTLYLYANDTLGTLNSTTVQFHANNTKIIVIYETFRGNKKGISTDFDSLSDEQLENLSGMILENTDYGKILWNENINIASDANASDRITTLDYNVIIANTSIFVNETELPNLNKQATLWFYNLTFNNPRVLRNGVVCPSSICSNQYYFSRTFRVDVTGFTNYSLEETSEESPAGGGGGGGQLNVTSNITFFFYPSLIKLNLIQGEKETATIKIKNFDTANLEFNLTSTLDMVRLFEDNFLIKPGEEKEITAYINVSENAEPEIYMGEIIITAKKGTQTATERIKVVIAVTEKGRFFDIKLNILPIYKKVKAGADVFAEVEIYNLGIIEKRVDVELRYSVRDLKNNILNEQVKTVAVETKFSEIAKITVPDDTPTGRYILAADVTYNSKRAFATDYFLVITEKKPFSTSLAFVLILAVLIVVLYFTWRRYKKFESAMRKTVISKMKLK